MIGDTHRLHIRIPAWKYEEIEKAVVDLYIEQWINTLSIDPFRIIRNRGYHLIPFTKLNKANPLECLLDKNNDAFSFYVPALKNYVIVYNDEKPFTRIRFTLMHEIGHIDLGHKGESDLAKKMADYYAGYALAPSPLIGRFASVNLSEIISTFQVSLDCAAVCSSRYQNWIQYGGRELKDYEVRLINLFQLF